jgi:DNA polymerase III subunit gamma/tau
VQRSQDLLRKVTGQAIAVRVELDRTATAPERPATEVSVSPPPVADRKRALAALPLFKKASETLGAQIWHVDDDFNPTAPPRTDKTQDTDADTDEG